MLGSEYESPSRHNKQEFDRYMDVINPRMGDTANESYVNVGKTNSIVKYP